MVAFVSAASRTWGLVSPRVRGGTFVVTPPGEHAVSCLDPLRSSCPSHGIRAKYREPHHPQGSGPDIGVALEGSSRVDEFRRGPVGVLIGACGGHRGWVRCARLGRVWNRSRCRLGRSGHAHKKSRPTSELTRSTGEKEDDNPRCELQDISIEAARFELNQGPPF